MPIFVRIGVYAGVRTLKLTYYRNDINKMVHYFIAEGNYSPLRLFDYGGIVGTGYMFTKGQYKFCFGVDYLRTFFNNVIVDPLYFPYTENVVRYHNLNIFVGVSKKIGKRKDKYKFDLQCPKF